MKTIISFLTGIAMIVFCSCSNNERQQHTIKLTYRQGDIQKQFDTLYNYQQGRSLSAHDAAYSGLIEQALARCHYSDTNKTIIQDVFSSMYLDTSTGNYDCVTTTVFKFKDGSITATGLFDLTPGDTIAPDHDFPVTGGSGAYRHIYGTYTRKYSNGVYNVELSYRHLP